MVRGDKFADIYDSPETIRQAQLDGYTLVKRTENEKLRPKQDGDKPDGKRQ